MGGAITEFCFGCVLIPLALVILWKNEKKVVMFAKCMDQGRELVQNGDCEDPDDANELVLVHLTGTTENKQEIKDNELDVSVNNSYRLKRKVEMYQWSETVRQDGKDHNGNTRKSYTYASVWDENKIESSAFNESHSHANPTNEWPYKS